MRAAKGSTKKTVRSWLRFTRDRSHRTWAMENGRRAYAKLQQRMAFLYRIKHNYNDKKKRKFWARRVSLYQE